MLSLNTTAFYNGKGLTQHLNRYNTDGYAYTMPGIPAYWTMDASLTYNSSRWVPEGVHWSARLWCNNLFNSHHLSTYNATDLTYIYNVTYDGAYGELPAQTGMIVGSHISPRTYGLTLNFDF